MSIGNETGASSQPIGLGRAFRWGFIVGLIALIPVVLLALVSNLGETLLPILAPGSLVLRLFGEATAEWPGWLSIGLAALANGVIYGAVAAAIAAVVNATRR